MQFHNLRHSLEGQDLHPKNTNLDSLFTACRLLGWMHSLDHLQLTTTELEAWLVHCEPKPLGPASLQGGQLQGDSGLAGAGDLSGLRMKEGRGSGGVGIRELGYGQVAVASDTIPGGGAPLLRGELQDHSGDIIKEEADPGQQSEVTGYGNQQLEPLLSSLNDDYEEDEFHDDIWSAGAQLQSHGSHLIGGDVQEGQFSAIIQSAYSELMGLDEEVFFSTQRPLLSPLIPPGDSTMDLEKQWQDVLAVMEPQDMDLDETAINLPVSNVQHAVATGLRDDDLVYQNVILHQASLPRLHEAAMDRLSHLGAVETQNHYSSNSSDSSFDLGSPHIVDLLLPPELNGTSNVDSELIDSALLIHLPEEPALASPLQPLLDEISLMDLALEEGFSPSKMDQLQKHLEDSDSGLSLNFSHSPVCLSESEMFSSSDSSPSSTGSFSEEDSVGYDPGYEGMEDTEAFQSHAAHTSKACWASFVEPSHFRHLPWLDSVGHDHTYNQKLPSLRSPEKPQKGCFEEPPELLIQSKCATRDEQSAHALRIPFSNNHIINLPVEEFNKLLARHKLSEAQLTLVRDIRRRGKNKMAAQNCRRRKLVAILGLEHNIKGLQQHQTRLFREKVKLYRSVWEMKQRLSSLCQEVFTRLRDHEGRPYSAQDYALQFTADGRIVLSPHHTSTESRCKPGKKQDRRK